MTERMSMAQMASLARETGDVDGIPMAVGSGDMGHRRGMFQIKDDIETERCRETGFDHKSCAWRGRSDDQARHTAITASLGYAKTLKPEAFDPYDEARFWSCP